MGRYDKTIEELKKSDSIIFGPVEFRDKIVYVTMLTFGRARICIGEEYTVDDSW